MSDATPIALARAALEDDKRATPGPWRFGIEFTRLIEDGNGYRFAQVDDDGNGHLIAHARTREPGPLSAALAELQAGRCPVCHQPMDGERVMGALLVALPCLCTLRAPRGSR